MDFIFFDAGGGHRAAATALKSVIDGQGRPWDVRLVNLQEILDPLDVFRKVTGFRLQDLYNLMLKKGWTLGSPQLTAAMHGVIRLYHRGQVRLLKQWWSESRPEMVVSLVPNFNRAMAQSLHATLPGVPFVTIITDLADYPPHFWIERQEQFLICGTQKAVDQARAFGHPCERVFRVSGMVLRPSFYQPLGIDRRRERERLGLKAGLPTGLVLFGGEGSNLMTDIARRAPACGIPLQLIFLCGKNEKLLKCLNSLPTPYSKFVQGFTPDIPYYMAVSDFLIGKPGPGSISEAVAMDLPVIIASNAWTLPQERYNAEWVREHGVGVVLRDFRHIAQGLREMLNPANFELFRRNAAAMQNRAVFEIPEILETLLPKEIQLRPAAARP